jgi:purine-binding chemotaxis protein CheW
METTILLFTFRLEGHWFGLEAPHVQEVIRRPLVTPVPLSHPCIDGVVNLRGDIVTLLDLGRRLEMEGAPSSRRRTCVLVRTEGETVGLAVDDASDVIEVSDKDREDLPSGFPNSFRDFVTSAYKLENRIVFTLNADALVRFKNLAEGGAVEA